MFLTIWNLALASPEFTFLVVGLTILLIVLVYWHMSSDVRFDLRDLLIDSKTKELSLSKTGQFLALLISTWVLMYETRAGRLTDWLFTGYMLAWAGANSLNKYLEQKNGSSQSSTTISTTSVSIADPQAPIK
jgi:hypothetical protein